MAKKELTKEEENNNDPLENNLLGDLGDTELLQEKIGRGQTFIEGNKNLLSTFAGVIVACVAGYYFFQYYTSNKNIEAYNQLFPAVFLFEKDSLGTALNGDGNFTDGLLAVSDDYGMTDAANLANFYAGTALLKQGSYKEAIDKLSSFSSDDYLVQARAYSLIGDAYMELGELGNAISFYGKAVNYNSNEQFTPSYLIKLGLAYEANKNAEKAAAAYQQVIDTYTNTNKRDLAKKLLAKLGK